MVDAVEATGSPKACGPIGSTPLPVHPTVAMQEAGAAEMRKQFEAGAIWPSKVWRAMVAVELAELKRVYAQLDASATNPERSEGTNTPVPKRG